MNWRAELETTLEAVPDGELAECIGELARHQAGLWLRVQRHSDLPEGDAPDHLLTCEDVAELLGTNVRWVQRHKLELGVIAVGRHLRFQREAVERYILRQQI